MGTPASALIENIGRQSHTGTVTSETAVGGSVVEPELGPQFGISPAFVDFLARSLGPGKYREAQWFNQTTERAANDWRQMRQNAQPLLERLLLHERASNLLQRALEWFNKLLAGDMRALRMLHRRFQFIAVVGIPRTGGTYLTAELFSALDYERREVHPAIAHDGFPDAQPFRLRSGENSWITALTSMAQYITAVELFFGGRASPRAVVPKKATKAVYAPGLFRAVMGPRSEYIVTVRHPIASCISTYERSGGLPPGGFFRARSTIERWIARDSLLMGSTRAELSSSSYFDVYARWWEQFHIKLALSSLLTGARCTVISYGRNEMEEFAAGLHTRFDSNRPIERFLCKGPLLDRHPEWIGRSESALANVAAAWRCCGRVFPVDSIMNCH